MSAYIILSYVLCRIKQDGGLRIVDLKAFKFQPNLALQAKWRHPSVPLWKQRNAQSVVFPEKLRLFQ